MEVLDSRSNALVLGVLSKAPDLTLATLMQDGAPHASTVSFANDGLVLYLAVGVHSQKAHNIRRHPQVALTVNAPYRQWSEIQALSIGAQAEIVSEPDQVRHASQLLLLRFPQFSNLIPDTSAIPWPGTLYIRIRPKTISLLNYEKCVGYTTCHTLNQAA